MNQQLIIDRFEEEWAVLEYNGETFNFPKALLPLEAKVGDVLTLSLSIDEACTTKKKESINDRFNRLRKK